MNVFGSDAGCRCRSLSQLLSGEGRSNPGQVIAQKVKEPFTLTPVTLSSQETQTEGERMQTSLQKAPGPAHNPQPFSCGVTVGAAQLQYVTSHESTQQGAGCRYCKRQNNEAPRATCDVEKITAASCVSCRGLD